MYLILLVLFIIVAGVAAIILFAPNKKVLVNTVTLQTVDPNYTYPVPDGKTVETIKYTPGGEVWVNGKPPVKGKVFDTWITSGVMGVVTKPIGDGKTQVTLSGMTGKGFSIYQCDNPEDETLGQVWSSKEIDANIGTVIGHSIMYNEDDLVYMSVLTPTNLTWYTWDGTNSVQGSNYVVNYTSVKSSGDYTVCTDNSGKIYVYFYETLTLTIDFDSVSLIDICQSGGSTILAAHDGDDIFRFYSLENGLLLLSSQLTLNDATKVTSSISIGSTGTSKYSLAYQKGNEVFRTVGADLSFSAPLLIAENALDGSKHISNKTLTSGTNITLYISDDVNMSYIIGKTSPRLVNPSLTMPTIRFVMYIDSNDRVYHHSLEVSKDGVAHRCYVTPEDASYDLTTVVNNIYA